MFKKPLQILTVALAMTGVNASTAQAEGDYFKMAGVAQANFIDQGEGNPVVIIATLHGSVAAAGGKITAQRETETGLEMDMEHYFMKEDGGFISTKDLGVLTAVPGKPDHYMLEVTYIVQPELSTGTLVGYEGQFKSYGLVNLAKMEGLVRYSGTLQK